MQTQALTRNGTEGRVYGGDCELVHIADGKRAMIGAYVAALLDNTMRKMAARTGARTAEQAAEQLLCPGCYMIALFNAAVHLANANGQPLSELGATMAQAFTLLAERADLDRPDELPVMEEIYIVLD